MTGVMVVIGIILGIVATGFVYIKVMKGAGGTFGLSIVAIIIMTIFVSIFGMIGNSLDGIPSSGTGRKDYSLECKVCERSFSDDANIKSIRSTNMCLNCYKIYNTAIGN